MYMHILELVASSDTCTADVLSLPVDLFLVNCNHDQSDMTYASWWVAMCSLWHCLDSNAQGNKLAEEEEFYMLQPANKSDRMCH